MRSVFVCASLNLEDGHSDSAIIISIFQLLLFGGGSGGCSLFRRSIVITRFCLLGLLRFLIISLAAEAARENFTDGNLAEQFLAHLIGSIGEII